jgi:hypothetical protein
MLTGLTGVWIFCGLISGSVTDYKLQNIEEGNEEVLWITGTDTRGKSKVNWVNNLYLQWSVDDVIVFTSGSITSSCDMNKLIDPLK